MSADLEGKWLNGDWREIHKVHHLADTANLTEEVSGTEE
jgi:hypothetical protein